MLAKGLFSLIVRNLSSNRCCSLLCTTAGETQFHFNMNRELFTQVLIKAIKAMSSVPFTMYTESEARVTKPRILDFKNGRRALCFPMHLMGSIFVCLSQKDSTTTSVSVLQFSHLSNGITTVFTDKSSREAEVRPAMGNI